MEGCKLWADFYEHKHSSSSRERTRGAARHGGDGREEKPPRTAVLSTSQRKAWGNRAQWWAAWLQGKVASFIVFSTWFLRMSSFKTESSGYGSNKNLDSLLKVNIGPGKKSWQKTPPGLPHTERIIQVMVKMDSTSTSAMRTPNGFQEQNSNGEAKPQNSIFGRGCNQNRCRMLHGISLFPETKPPWRSDDRLSLLFLCQRSQSAFLNVLNLAKENLIYPYLDCILCYWGKKCTSWITFFFFFSKKLFTLHSIILAKMHKFPW